MNTAVINIKIEPEIKARAQKVASELGMSLSGILNAYLTQLVRTKSINFSAKEQASEYLLKELKKSKDNKKGGWVSPSFTNAKEASLWLNNPNSHYENGDKVQ